MSGAWVRAFLARAVLFALAWWALSDGQPEYAAYGVVAVLLAVTTSLALLPPSRADRSGGPQRDGRGAIRRIAALGRLVGWYLRRMTAGATDVARRSVARPAAIDPVVRRAPLRLPPGIARVLAIGMVNLMPGSLVQWVGDESVELHVLAGDMDAEREWEELQARVAAVAGIRLRGDVADAPE